MHVELASCSTLLLEQKGWTELLSNDISKNQNINAYLGTSFQQLLPRFFFTSRHPTLAWLIVIAS